MEMLGACARTRCSTRDDPRLHYTSRSRSGPLCTRHRNVVFCTRHRNVVFYTLSIASSFCFCPCPCPRPSPCYFPSLCPSSCPCCPSLCPIPSHSHSLIHRHAKDTCRHVTSWTSPPSSALSLTSYALDPLPASHWGEVGVKDSEIFVSVLLKSKKPSFGCSGRELVWFWINGLKGSASEARNISERDCVNKWLVETFHEVNNWRSPGPEVV